jgi:hypothetical protein
VSGADIPTAEAMRFLGLQAGEDALIIHRVLVGRAERRIAPYVRQRIAASPKVPQTALAAAALLLLIMSLSGIRSS